MPLAHMRNPSTSKKVCATDLGVDDALFERMWYATPDEKNGRELSFAFIIAFTQRVVSCPSTIDSTKYNSPEVREDTRRQLRSAVKERHDILFLPRHTSQVVGVNSMRLIPYETDQYSAIATIQSLMHMCTTDGVIVQGGYKSPYFVKSLNPLRTQLEPCYVFIVKELNDLAVTDRLIAKYRDKNIAVFTKRASNDCTLALIINSVRENISAVVVETDDFTELVAYTGVQPIDQDKLLEYQPHAKFVVCSYQEQTLVETHSSAQTGVEAWSKWTNASGS